MKAWAMPVLGLAALCVWGGSARADAKSKAAQEVAEVVMAKFGARAGRSLPSLAAKIETFAARHGKDGLTAVRRCGPEAFAAVERAGVNAPRAVRVLALHGEEGASRVLASPRGMRQFLTHGEGAAAALVRHPGVAEGIIEKGGIAGVRALAGITPQGARRVAMMLEGELKGAAKAPLLDVIGRYGQRACDFIWSNKTVLAGTAAMAAFLHDPAPYLDGTKKLVEAAGEAVVKPVLGSVVEVAKPAVGGLFTLLTWAVGILAAAVAAAAVLGHRWGLLKPAMKVAIGSLRKE